MNRRLFGSSALILLLLGPPFLGDVSAQKDIKSTTTGTCSPIVTGGSSQITINCNGLSAAKANQMVALMNRILAERLDLSEVNSKIDQLHTDIGGLNDTLKIAVNGPLANAPEPVKALLKQGAVVLTRCSNFQRNWSQKELETMERVTRDRTAAVEKAASPTSEADRKDGQMFAQTYLPKLVAENAEFHRLMPDAPPVKDVTASATLQEAMSYNLAVFSLAKRYQNQQGNARLPVNPRLTTGAQQLWTDCLTVLNSWSRDQLSALSTSHSRPFVSNLLTPAMEQMNQDESAQYRLTLEPQLVAFRDAVLPKVPEFSSGQDYGAVTKNVQLSGVCTDLVNLNTAYTQKVTEEARLAAGKR